MRIIETIREHGFSSTGCVDPFWVIEWHPFVLNPAFDCICIHLQFVFFVCLFVFQIFKSYASRSNWLISFSGNSFMWIITRSGLGKDAFEKPEHITDELDVVNPPRDLKAPWTYGRCNPFQSVSSDFVFEEFVDYRLMWHFVERFFEFNENLIRDKPESRV